MMRKRLIVAAFFSLLAITALVTMIFSQAARIHLTTAANETVSISETPPVPEAPRETAAPPIGLSDADMANALSVIESLPNVPRPSGASTSSQSPDIRFYRLLVKKHGLDTVFMAAHDSSDDQRRQLLDAVIEDLTMYLDSLENREANASTESSFVCVNGGFPFPMLLARLDHSGDSLPQLLRWYDVDATQTKQFMQSIAKSGLLDTLDIPENVQAQSNIQPHIKRALKQIFDRLHGQETKEEMVDPIAALAVGVDLPDDAIDRVRAYVESI